MKLNKKVIATAAFAALTIAAFAAANWGGYLAPQEQDDWVSTLGKGWHTIDIEGFGQGDLDIFVYDENGYLLDKDDLPDNQPVAEFYLSNKQEISFKVINASRTASASYEGTIE